MAQSDLMQRMRREQQANQLMGMAQGLLGTSRQGPRRTPHTWQGALGDAVTGYNSAPQMNPMQMGLLDLQMKSAQQKTGAAESDTERQKRLNESISGLAAYPGSELAPAQPGMSPQQIAVMRNMAPNAQGAALGAYFKNQHPLTSAQQATNTLGYAGLTTRERGQDLTAGTARENRGAGNERARLTREQASQLQSDRLNQSADHFTRGLGQKQFLQDQSQEFKELENTKARNARQKLQDSRRAEHQRLQNRYEKLDSGSPRAKSIKKRMDKLDTITQTTQYDPSVLSRKTGTNLEQKIFSANEGMARLTDIAASYKPAFQQYSTRANALFTAIREKAGFKPSAADRKELADFSTFKRNALDNINLHIKEITGAQMSKAEADRIKAAMPDAGKGIFGGDSPTEFEAKLKSTMKSLQLAKARYLYHLRNGLDPSRPQFSIEGTKGQIDRRGQEIQLELEQQFPGARPESIRNTVKQRLRQEFGI